MKLLIALGFAATLTSCASAPSPVSHAPVQTATIPSAPSPVSHTPVQTSNIATPIPPSVEPPPPPTGNWQYISQSNDGTVLYIEATNSNGNIRQYWSRLEYPNGLTNLMFTTADCNEGTYFFSWMEKYDGGGRKTAAGVPQQAGVKKNSIPGSIGGSAFEVMCKDWRN